MSDYTPTFESDTGEVSETPVSGRYGSGVGFHDNENEEQEEGEGKGTATPNENEEQEEGTATPNEGDWVGEPRHPIIILSHSSEDAQYHQTLTDWTLHGCDCGVSQITAEVNEFPPTDEVTVQVFGIREGDTDRVSASVIAAGPLELSLESPSKCLGRMLDKGCIICEGQE